LLNAIFSLLFLVSKCFRLAAALCGMEYPLMKQYSHRIVVGTRGRGLYEFTAQAREQLRASGLKTGLLTLFVQHTSASLLIQENADPEVRRDFERFFARLVPDGDPLLEHNAEGPDDMPAHIRTALTTVHLSVPFANGELCLGTWQGIYLWEHRTSPHQRRIVAHFLGE
jgi:secondary thiamine-phosphate synthase enzyme